VPVPPVKPPVVPDYSGACIANVVPGLIRHLMGGERASWMPNALANARQVVLLLLDGLGWEQLQDRTSLMPTLTAFDGGPITSVAPTTTAAGLTSLVTGKPPAIHGIAGYRLSVGDNGILNVLRWTCDEGDAMESVPPADFQLLPAFAGNEVPAVVQKEFIGTGFTAAHLQGADIVGYAMPSSLPIDIWRLAKAGHQFIYGYYKGIDAVAHANGLGEHFDGELYTADRLIRDLIAGLPSGCALVVTSDHGQVDVGNRVLEIDADIVERCWRASGEGRFRWLHAKGDVEELRAVCEERYGELAWVKTKQELSDEGWFGGPLNAQVSDRLGDIAIVAAEPIAFRDPFHGGERQMMSRHGSMTSAEVYVPLLAHTV
jgi:predicted AlkP superfamily pyrophosphatase or phosphodiesterase